MFFDITKSSGHFFDAHVNNNGSHFISYILQSKLMNKVYQTINGKYLMLMVRKIEMKKVYPRVYVISKYLFR